MQMLNFVHFKRRVCSDTQKKGLTIPQSQFQRKHNEKTGTYSQWFYNLTSHYHKERLDSCF